MDTLSKPQKSHLRSSSACGVDTALMRTASSETPGGGGCRDRPARCSRRAVRAAGFADGVTESSRSYVMLSDVRPRDLLSIRGEDAGTFRFLWAFVSFMSCREKKGWEFAIERMGSSK